MNIVISFWLRYLDPKFGKLKGLACVVKKVESVSRLYLWIVRMLLPINQGSERYDLNYSSNDTFEI